MVGETAEVQTGAPRSACLCNQPSAVDKGFHHVSEYAHKLAATGIEQHATVCDNCNLH